MSAGTPSDGALGLCMVACLKAWWRHQHFAPFGGPHMEPQRRAGAPEPAEKLRTPRHQGPGHHPGLPPLPMARVGQSGRQTSFPCMAGASTLAVPYLVGGGAAAVVERIMFSYTSTSSLSRTRSVLFVDKILINSVGNNGSALLQACRPRVHRLLQATRVTRGLQASNERYKRYTRRGRR
jgi:hypothetical protein